MLYLWCLQMLSAKPVEDDEIRDGRTEQLITPEVVPVVAIRPSSHSTQGSQNFDAVAITVDEPLPATALPIGLGRMLGGRDLDPQTLRQVKLVIFGTKCCVGCLNVVNLAYLAAGLAFLALEPDARDDACGRVIWSFDVAALSLCSLIGMLGLLAFREIMRLMARIEDPSLPDHGSFFTRLNHFVSVCVNYALFIYGTVVWQRLSKLDNACRKAVMIQFPNLYGWYSVTYWMAIVFISTQVLTICNKKQGTTVQSGSGEEEEAGLEAGNSTSSSIRIAHA